MNRTGKIARLPREIRQELNERLSNGEAGESLVAWLNGLPEVQAIMAAEFEGVPIREQNISEWRKGGYLDSLDVEDAFEVVERLRDGAEELLEEGNPDLVKALEYYVSSRQALRTKEAATLEGKAKWELWRQICKGLVQQRRVELQAEKLEVAEERLAWKKEVEMQIHAAAPAERAEAAKYRARAAAARRGEFTEEEEEEAIAECDAIYKSESGEEAFYYRKLREDAEDAEYLERGELPPNRDYQIDWAYGQQPPYHYQKTEMCQFRERAQARKAAAMNGGVVTEAEANRKQREDAEDKEYLARLVMPPTRDYEIDWSHGTEPPYHYKKTERCLANEAWELAAGKRGGYWVEEVYPA